MTKWFILPGMGATSAMYDRVRFEITFEVNFVEWPEYEGERTYADVAQRVIKENGISDGDIVGGSSLGGMVALELAKVLQSKAVVLLGSAISRQEVRWILSVLSPLAAIMPVSLIQMLARKHDSLLAQMFSKSNPEFVRAMCLHLSSWSGYDGPMDSIFRLHGMRDRVIPCPATGTEIVESAGHFLAISHPKECALFLDKVENHLGLAKM